MGTHLVLLVLPGVRKARNDGRDPGCGGDLAGVDHDQQLHDHVVDLAASALHDEDVVASDGFSDLDAKGENQRHETESSFNQENN